MKASAWVIAAAALLGLATPALARHHVSHYRHYRYHHRYRHHGGSLVPHYAHPGVMPNVLVANPYGDVIIDGKTGFHRSDLGVMVPDTDPPSFVATGRAAGSGFGANGLPGSNWQ